MKSIRKFGNDASNRIMVIFNSDKLAQLEKQLGVRYAAQIGVLGEKAAGRQVTGDARKGGGHKVGKGDSSLTNAEIGLIHEKGSHSRNIPRRSFLEIPLTTMLRPLLNKVGQAILMGINAGNIEKAYGTLAAIGEGVVLKAFSTSGYGMWQPLKAATIRRKKSSRPLIDTAQLRQSIASRVVAHAKN